MFDTVDLRDDRPSPKARDFLIYPWLQPGRLTMIIGGRNVGKSMITQDMIAACVNGKHLFGRYPTSSITSVLYLHAEHTADSITEVANERKDIPKGKVHVVQDFKGYGSSMILDGKPHTAMIRELESTCAHHKPNLIIAEPLPAFLEKSENDNKEVRLLIQILTDLARKTKAAVLCHHHFGKAEFDPEHQRFAGIGGSRGAASFEDTAERVLYLRWTDPKNLCHVKLETMKQKGYDVEPVHLLRDPDLLRFDLFDSALYGPDVIGLYSYLRKHPMPKAVAIPKLSAEWKCTAKFLELLYKRCAKVELLDADGRVLSSTKPPELAEPKEKRSTPCPIVSTL